MEMQKQDKWKLAAIIVVLSFVLLNVIGYFFYPAIMPWFQQRQAGEEVIENTYDAEKAVNEYEWFRQQYRDIEAQRQQIENHQEELDRFYEIHGKDAEEWSRTAAEDHSRIQKRITGNQNKLEQMVADYNARSDMANREIFKCHLPYQVDENFYISGQPGSDAPDQPQDKYVDEANPDREPPEPEECDALPDQIEN